MSRRRLPLGVLLPAGLVVLVAALAFLQYRWLGQVSDAEREELSRSLNQRAQEFADDVDLELGRAYLAFQLGDTPVTVTATEAIDQRIASWRAVARYPDLVGTIYLASAGPDGQALHRYEAGRGWTATDWPAHLSAVRERLTPQVLKDRSAEAPFERQIITLSTATLVPDVPALVVPVAQPRPDPPAPDVLATGTVRFFEQRTTDVLMSLDLDRVFLVLELDRPYLETTMLASVADRHFGDPAGSRYRIAVVNQAGTQLLARGLPAGGAIEESTADVSMRFFRVRLDLARKTAGSVLSWQGETPAVARSGPAGRAVPLSSSGTVSIVVGRATTDTRTEVRSLMADTGWRLLVQHAAGSLDAAVAEARRRNLWLSFGILSVLVASVGLIVLNARRSERLAAQQMDFVATVSHELRTPLAVIRSAAQNLAAGVVHDGEQARRYGHLIETEGRRLTDMVEQVLEYAGLSGNRGLRRAEPVAPGDLVRDALEPFASLAADQGVRLDVSIARDLPLIAADGDGVRRALDNLVTNALKYAADGGWIGVSVTRGGTPGAPEVRIAVSDRGRGIDPEDVPHIFEPFYRGRYAIDRQIHGNGLGLCLVRRIAEAHGGRATLATATGQGTTVTLHLPGLEPDRSSEPLGEAAADAGPRA